MTQREKAEFLRETFPLMDASFLNKCLQPERSGGELTRESKELLGIASKPPIRREIPGTHKYTIRLAKGQIAMLQQAKKHFRIDTDQLIISKAVDVALGIWGF